ncbi:MAG: peptidase M4 family protein [Fibrobacteres bacterium]|nr:peptidase M4 family protein [Fibrobacterota bacterium]
MPFHQTVHSSFTCALLVATAVQAYTPGAALKGAPGAASRQISAAELQAIARKIASTRPAAAAKLAAGPTAAAPAASAPSLQSVLRNRSLQSGPTSVLPVPGRALANGPGFAWMADNGTPAYLDGRSMRSPDPAGARTFTAAKAAPVAPGDRAMAYFRANKDLLKLQDPSAELRFQKQFTDVRGSRHEIFQQVYQGVAIWNGQINAHFDGNGALYAVNAHYAPTRAPLGSWRLDAKTAIDRAVADLSLKTPFEDFTPEMRAQLDYSGPAAEKNVWMEEENGSSHFAWRVEIRPDLCHLWRYFIDAASGAILEKYDAANSDGVKTASAQDLFGTARTINTYQVGSTYYLIDGTRKSFSTSGLPGSPKGALWTETAGKTDLTKLSQITSTNNTWTDQSSVSAHYNMAKVYEYYLNTHNRNAIDGAGGTMIAAVHVTEGGQAMDNAYFNGRLMAYGDGNRIFKPLARALDVTAHEMTHGVIAATVNLDYKNQAGALNESLADVFGCLIEGNNWTMGEDVVNNKTAYPTGALRDLADPHNGGKSRSDASWQPAHMLEFVKTTLADDNGGVHINNGIPNHAAYLIAQAIGREEMGKIYYRVLDARYLNPGSQFMDMRLAAVRSATDLYGETSPEVKAVRDAFTAVGVGSASSNDIPTPRPPDRSPLTGTQFVVVEEAKTGDSSLYLAKSVIAGDTDVTHLSKTQIFTGSGRPISVTADGSLILFVDAKQALRAVDASGERVVDATTAWKSVAVSPDGTKAAATTLQADAKIHVLDLVHPDQSKSIALYTPSAGQTTQANTMPYADAVEFNYTGESIVFDALNSVPQAGGSPLEFWNAYLVDVQSGIISPFLPSLPDGVSVGNPSFAQTTDLNVAFDLIDDYTGTFSVMAADLFTGAYHVLDSNATVPGGPRYSTRDDKIVFTRKTGTTLNVFQLPLAKDKITASGKAVTFLANAQRPVWFARGARSTGFALPQARLPESYGLADDAGGALRLDLPASAAIIVTIYDAQGRKLGDLARGSYPAGTHRIAWAGPAGGGMYLVRLTAHPDTGPAWSMARWVIR